jgi:hypothetical protein
MSVVDAVRRRGGVEHESRSFVSVRLQGGLATNEQRPERSSSRTSTPLAKASTKRKIQNELRQAS